MDFFVISDIHGSTTALKRAIQLYKSGNYQKIIICGDLLYHGARNPLPAGYNPKEVIEILNDIKQDIVAVKGNCESEVDSMVLDFPLESLYSYIYNENREIFITHGHRYNTDNIEFLREGSIVLSGHTHIPKAKMVNGLYDLNPGSISLPKGGFPPSYGILTESSWMVFELESGGNIHSINF